MSTLMRVVQYSYIMVCQPLWELFHGLSACVGVIPWFVACVAVIPRFVACVGVIPWFVACVGDIPWFVSLCGR